MLFDVLGLDVVMGVVVLAAAVHVGVTLSLLLTLAVVLAMELETLRIEPVEAEANDEVGEEVLP